MIESKKLITTVQFDIYTNRANELLPIIGDLAAKHVIVQDSIRFEGNDPEIQGLLGESMTNPSDYNMELVSFIQDQSGKTLPIIEDGRLKTYVVEHGLTDKGGCQVLLGALWYEKRHSWSRNFKFMHDDGKTNKVLLIADMLPQLNHLIEVGQIDMWNVGPGRRKLLKDIEAAVFLNKPVST